MAKSALSSLQDACKTAALVNPKNYKKKKGRLVPNTNILAKLCPDNCNKRGRCVNGKCRCYRGYGSSDCSVDKENLQSCKDCNLKACVTWGNVLADLQVCTAEVSGKVTWAVTYRKLGYVLKKYVYVSVVLVSVIVCAFLILNRFAKYRITKNDINLLSKENE